MTELSPGAAMSPSAVFSPASPFSPSAAFSPTLTGTPTTAFSGGARDGDGMERVREWARARESMFAASVATQEPPPVYQP